MRRACQAVRRPHLESRSTGRAASRLFRTGAETGKSLPQNRMPTSSPCQLSSVTRVSTWYGAPGATPSCHISATSSCQSPFGSRGEAPWRGKCLLPEKAVRQKAPIRHRPMAFRWIPEQRSIGILAPRISQVFRLRPTVVLRQGGPSTFSMQETRNPALACSTFVRTHMLTSEFSDLGYR